jgi:hypothetical protein
MPLSYYHTLKENGSYALITVPIWTANRLFSLSLPLSDLLDYAKMKTCFTQEDLTEVFICQSLLPTFPAGLSTTLGEGSLAEEWEERLNPEQKAEYCTDIAIMRENFDNKMDQLIERFKTQSTLPSVNLEEIVAMRYEQSVQLHNGIIFIILDGYMYADKAIDEQKSAYFLIVQILKKLYSYNAISDVSKTEIFKQYLKLLSE